uniref:BEACH-type PH domain-containing protein n=1 Tax=Rhabditophanes sp. KR3021 TaxID=114890 RepID=A0AC35TXD5_9BILA
MFWKLDVWEDDSRRRKRFIPNPHGGRLSMAKLHALMDSSNEESISAARQKLLKQLIDKKALVKGGGHNWNELFIDDKDMDKWVEETMEVTNARKELNSVFSTKGRLIAPGLVIPGTISITKSDLYFDADEDDELYKKQNPKVRLF